MQLRSGQPFTVDMTVDVANIGSPTTRPNLLGDPKLSDPSPSRWFNTSDFAAPSAFTYGSAGRNILRSGALDDVDLSVFREDKLAERLRSQFRVEAFNLFNHAAFGIPGSSFTNQRLLGVVSSTVSRARQVQLALKLMF